MNRDDAQRMRYEQWVDQWATDLFRFAVRLCGRRDLADDLVQETFFHAWRSMDTLRDDSRARAWLFQILRHRWSHAVRTDTRRPRTTAPLESVTHRADDDAEAPLDRMSRREQVQTALAGLDERYRLPLLLVFVEGMTCREAADELNVPLGTVLSRIHRARKAMRTALADLDDETVRHESTDSEAGDDSPPLRIGGAG